MAYAVITRRIILRRIWEDIKNEKRCEEIARENEEYNAQVLTKEKPRGRRLLRRRLLRRNML